MKETLKKQIEKLKGDIEWDQKKLLEAEENALVYAETTLLDEARRTFRVQQATEWIAYHQKELAQKEPELAKAQALLARLEEEAA